MFPISRQHRRTNQSDTNNETFSLTLSRPSLAISLVIADINHGILELPGGHPAVKQNVQLAVRAVLEL
jgi:hypothetical protein